MWHEIESSCRTFQFQDDPELLHIIKTGFREPDMAYSVVWEDAAEQNLGKTELMSQKSIEIRFNIHLDDQ